MDISASGGQYFQQGRVPINDLSAALLTYQDADLFQCAGGTPEAVWRSAIPASVRNLILTYGWVKINSINSFE